MGLELPEDSFVKQHNWDAIGETYSKNKHFCVICVTLTKECSSLHEIVRALNTPSNALVHDFSSYPRSAEEEAKSNNVWLKGHTGEHSVPAL